MIDILELRLYVRYLSYNIELKNKSKLWANDEKFISYHFQIQKVYEINRL